MKNKDPYRIRRFRRTVEQQELKVDYLRERLLERQLLGDLRGIAYYQLQLQHVKQLLAELRTLPLPGVPEPVKKARKRKAA